MPVSPRFGLDDLLGNEVVDFNVLQSNNNLLDAAAANLSLANDFANTVSVRRAAATDPAFTTRLNADAPASPKFTISADGTLTWPTGSLSYAAGVLNVGGTALNTSRFLGAAGTAAAPTFSFTGDPDTGLFDASSDVLGVAVGGVEVNRINNTGEIRFNRTNARVAAYTSDDPATPGERLLVINALTVTPGRLYAASLTVNGPLQVNGSETITTNLTVSGATTVSGTLQANGVINAYGGRINFEGSNVVMIQWRGDLGALYIPYGNGIYTTSGTFTGNVGVSGYVNIAGRLITAGYDPGWQNCFGGQVITNSRFYQRGNGGYYCWDAGDFTFGVGIAASTLVQRDGAGQIQAQSVYMPSAAQGGKPAYVCGQTGDGYLRWWPASAVGPPSLRQYGFPAWGGQDGGGTAYTGSITVGWTGYYSCFGYAKAGEYSRPDWGGSGQWPPELYMEVNGGVQGIGSNWRGNPYHNMGDGWFGVGAFVFIGAGGTVRMRGRWCYTGSGDLAGSVTFVPTDAYPG